MSMLKMVKADPCDQAIAEICAFAWDELSAEDLVRVAWGYYYFSIQFRENLQLACEFFPEDPKLGTLKTEECDTANLSPYPGVAAPGERMDHDEFMRRTLTLSPIDEDVKACMMDAGARYLAEVRAVDPMVRALSIASYEDGGLERLFTAILTAPEYNDPLIKAFNFFLSEHIRFDSDPDAGHGNLSRHLVPDENVAQLWTALKHLFMEVAPDLMRAACVEKLNAAC
jgi:hypothetical protein